MTKRSLLAAALLALAVPAAATLQFSANINGFVLNCVDNAACDTDPLLGRIAIADQTHNGVEIVGTSQFQTIGGTDVLNTSSFQVVNHNLSAATVQLAVGGINFIGPASLFSESGSGTWQNAVGSTLASTFWADPTNTQGADNPTDLPGTLLFNFNSTATNPADAFSANQNSVFNVGALFGMSLGASGTLIAWNGVVGQEPTLVGRSQTILTNQQQVPEPGTLALLGVALAGAGLLRRRAV